MTMELTIQNFHRGTSEMLRRVFSTAPKILESQHSTQLTMQDDNVADFSEFPLQHIGEDMSFLLGCPTKFSKVGVVLN